MESFHNPASKRRSRAIGELDASPVHDPGDSISLSETNEEERTYHTAAGTLQIGRPGANPSICIREEECHRSVHRRGYRGLKAGCLPLPECASGTGIVRTHREEDLVGATPPADPQSNDS